MRTVPAGISKAEGGKWLNQDIPGLTLSLSVFLLCCYAPPCLSTASLNWACMTECVRGREGERESGQPHSITVWALLDICPLCFFIKRRPRSLFLVTAVCLQTHHPDQEGRLYRRLVRISELTGAQSLAMHRKSDLYEKHQTERRNLPLVHLVDSGCEHHSQGCPGRCPSCHPESGTFCLPPMCSVTQLQSLPKLLLEGVWGPLNLGREH